MKKTAVSILSALAGAAFGAGAVGKMPMDKIQKKQAMSDKHFALFIITFFDEIEEKLAEKVDCPIISLEDVLYEV